MSFTVVMASEEKMTATEQAPGGLLKKFKIESSMSTSNMMLFAEGNIKQFSTPLEVLEEYVPAALLPLRPHYSYHHHHHYHYYYH